MNNKQQRGFTILELLMAIAGISAVLIAVTVVYVLCHFIAKFW